MRLSSAAGLLGSATLLGMGGGGVLGGVAATYSVAFFSKIAAGYLADRFGAVSYNVGRVGGIVSPWLIGRAGETYSSGLGIALLGVSHAICALIPGLLIREWMYDPRAVDAPEAAARATHRDNPNRRIRPPDAPL
jgi:hypothetical protein